MLDGRGRSLTIGGGWHDVADVTLKWLSGKGFCAVSRASTARSYSAAVAATLSRPAQIVTSFVMRGERDPPHAQDI